MTQAPWVVIEILSPEDRLPEQLRRFRDFANAGVLHIVLLDPEDLVAYRCEQGSLIETRFTTLDLPTGRLPFDSSALFQQLTEELAAGPRLTGHGHARQASVPKSSANRLPRGHCARAPIPI